ncbi:MAG: aminoacyl-tRNA hydrolase [Candidatus Omnitrophica bacterium]|nr:aminoacyl-tRNA hydrolase [Candidatus Omnitrophota bacterium]MCM8831137.1 aminoacyl-tRNA hydrolase [Candidatus Omnitrophota bacterium]
MKIIFGLGNPGIKYKNNRHNLGYMVVEKCVERYKNLKFSNSNKFLAYIAKVILDNNEIFFVKPKTFMNNSGYCVKKIVTHYSVKLSDILVVYDDIDLPFGKIRFREKGSCGGHRGLLSILELLGTDNINRLRIGIGRPQAKGEVVNYVLSDFTFEEKRLLQPIIDKAVIICFDWVSFGAKYVMANYN